ncbi:MAG: hypothetical protein ACRDJU_00665 [Actinomycetota bacterium]
MAKTAGSNNYDPYEIAIAIIALEEGYPLGVAATYLRRDRSGLHKALPGSATRPGRPGPIQPASTKTSRRPSLPSAGGSASR